MSTTVTARFHHEVKRITYKLKLHEMDARDIDERVVAWETWHQNRVIVFLQTKFICIFSTASHRPQVYLQLEYHKTWQRHQTTEEWVLSVYGVKIRKSCFHWLLRNINSSGFTVWVGCCITLLLELSSIDFLDSDSPVQVRLKSGHTQVTADGNDGIFRRILSLQFQIALPRFAHTAAVAVT